MNYANIYQKFQKSLKIQLLRTFIEKIQLLS